jgi:hypothetical protein
MLLCIKLCTLNKLALAVMLLFCIYEVYISAVTPTTLTEIMCWIIILLLNWNLYDVPSTQLLYIIVIKMSCLLIIISIRVK